VAAPGNGSVRSAGAGAGACRGATAVAAIGTWRAPMTRTVEGREAGWNCLARGEGVVMASIVGVAREVTSPNR
jgi:hypothetical protein